MTINTGVAVGMTTEVSGLEEIISTCSVVVVVVVVLSVDATCHVGMYACMFKTTSCIRFC